MEDYYILRNIIKQGLDKGYMSSVIKDAEHQTIEIFEDQWRLSNGFSLGSTWDIILNKQFADVMWGEDAGEHLMNIVVVSNSDRISYLKKFVKEDSKEQVEEEEQEKVRHEPTDALMAAIMRANEHLRENSEGLFKDTCDNCYAWVEPVSKKISVTALNENDYIMLNAANKATGGNVYDYFRQNGKAAFGVCPDCGKSEMKHDQGCSIEKKTMDWLIGQNDGC